jgi:uncharacterized membrane protein (UPF0182 family)
MKIILVVLTLLAAVYLFAAINLRLTYRKLL